MGTIAAQAGILMRMRFAVLFLLLLAIADDAFGLLVLAIFYPVLPVQFAWLLLSVAAVGGGLLLRRADFRTALRMAER